MRPTVAAESLGEMTTRHCPICGSTDDSLLFAEQRLDLDALDEHAFSSRKNPEHMRLRLVQCPTCDLAYASPIPSSDALARAYDDAAFDSAEEARYAAVTYGHELRDVFARLPERRGALDIGTGEGAFLSRLLDLGFSDVGGVEPSRAPIEAAAPTVQSLIEHSVFHSDVREPGSLSLVTCFQTIEHVPDPAELVRDAVALLRPGGVFALVCHNRRGTLNRLLGMRSPIIDLEHMQLFSPRSVANLLMRAGLREVSQCPIRNRYPIRYWIRLLPLPQRIRPPFSSAIEASGLASRSLTLPVGNLLAWGVRG